eukprot:gnl/TRDRNA2_/TRDRNA2_175885_c2_seq8.p1 gnl/TRDRNA2_/TRDRNA2_175885_c2~~gnl/TRDRNA2_/TRDRNA2_175885_c2_seq8.p1  ORF type:complete len:406 (+),score=64.83 gnl/TRDRNA2_/TRDRNA2_175885_c2_seq8:24-1220(+)
MVGQASPELFEALARQAERRLHEFTPQGLANLVWAFTAAGLSDTPLFAALANVVEQRINTFPAQAVYQLHQWVLWHRELKLDPPVSAVVRGRCLAAFRAIPVPSPSQLLIEVAKMLTKLGAHVEKQQVVVEGYRIDVIAQWEGQRIAVDVNGPSCYLKTNTQRSLDGATLLKHRQLTRLGWLLIVVPFLEWDALQGMESKRREYLLEKLRLQGNTPMPSLSPMPPTTMAPEHESMKRKRDAADLPSSDEVRDTKALVADVSHEASASTAAPSGEAESATLAAGAAPAAPDDEGEATGAAEAVPSLSLGWPLAKAKAWMVRLFSSGAGSPLAKAKSWMAKALHGQSPRELVAQRTADSISTSIPATVLVILVACSPVISAMISLRRGPFAGREQPLLVK